MEFKSFPKIPRWDKIKNALVTEKIDGTNAQIFISDTGEIRAGSRNRWIFPGQDNFGFAKWVEENKEELLKLGPGRHFGEWWGSGIQRRYDQEEKQLSLFNVHRWRGQELPSCVSLVPVLAEGPINKLDVDDIMFSLQTNGSIAAPGFMNPEGIVISFNRTLIKLTLDKRHKWEHEGK